MPAGEDAIDIRPVDTKTKNEEGDGAEEGKNGPSGGDSSTADRTGTSLPVLSVSKNASSENPEEETKGRQTERTRS